MTTQQTRDPLLHAEQIGEGIVQLTGPAGAGIVDPLDPDPIPEPVLSGHNIAAALRDLALEIGHGRLDGIRSYPDQAVSIVVSATSADAVQEVAHRFGVSASDMERHTLDDGAVLTAAEIGFGEGTETASWSRPTFRHAVILRVVHLAEATR